MPKIEIMHTGIDRQTGTVAEKILYSVEAIDPFSKVSESSLYFNGHFRLTEKGWEKLDKTIKQSPILFLGRGKTRGQGEIELDLSPASLEQDHVWEEWNHACGRTLQEITKQNHNGTYFSITLLSDAIMVDKFLRYTTTMDLPFVGSQLLVSILKQGFAFGWNQVHRLPKEDEKTISRSSVFLFHYPGQIDEIMGSLLDMQTNGIGLRRNEGFGQILINDPFHNSFCGIKEGNS
ncbi:MAG: hypothetical protein A2Y79_11040 [Deltaproteobacteria bacterium RBG_13_43_22]|nr:MAG: hypothetical protein A2Y79_11040 [Deltaproteobacteria bacterium RBG_13_43_22]